MRRGIPNLMKDGSTSLSGLEQAVLRNIEACKQLTDVTRTSFGPNGMNKMIINHLGKIFVTTDCATIMQVLSVYPRLLNVSSALICFVCTRKWKSSTQQPSS